MQSPLPWLVDSTGTVQHTVQYITGNEMVKTPRPTILDRL